MYETLESLLKLYKNDKVTDYVVEKEFAKYIGDHVGVKIIKDAATSNTSYVAFVIPEKHVEGFYLNIILDKFALNKYNESEIITILNKLKEKKFIFTKKYHEFLTDKSGNEVTFSDAMGFLLNLYSLYRNDLAFKCDEYLPAEDEILKIADKYNTGEATQEDTENLLVKHFINYAIISYIEKYVNESIKLDFTGDKPRVNDFGDEIDAFSKDQTFVPFGHVEIKHDYKPSTNQ